MSVCTYCHSTFKGDSSFCCRSCELLSNWMTLGKSPIKKINSVSKKWIKYNQVELESTFNISTCPVYKKFKFYIEGLQCSSCVHLLEDFPAYCDDITFSRLDYARHTFEVEAKPTISLGTICEALEQMGYTPTPLKEDSDYNIARKLARRNDLIRIGIAGAIAGNEMLFSVPIYAGLGGDLNFVFKWISFFIFLPVVLFVAKPFYKKAWFGLVIRQINVDMMIVVALLAGFLFSTFSLFKNSDEIYFDSTASFIFLILITRFVLKSHQDKLIRKNIFSDLFANDIYELSVDGLVHFVKFDQIKKDQVYSLKKNQLNPCDAQLLAKVCELDLSFLTGEAFPQVKHEGELILAGSRLVSENAKLICLNEPGKSDLELALKLIESNQSTKSQIQSLSDVVSHWLTLTVFSIAAVFFIFTYKVLGFEAFKRCLALITIACPCAVAFGTPLAHSLGMRKASKNGFFIKSDIVFERLHRIKKIIFDKTGTLTSSQLNLIKSVPQIISDDDKAIILGLEKVSLHPVALTFKKKWADTRMAEIAKMDEIAGVGIEAIHAGHQYKLMKSNESPLDGLLHVDYWVDHRKMASFYFAENIKPEAAVLVRKLKDYNYQVKMLTGDQQPRAIAVANLIGINEENIYFEQSSQMKMSVVQHENPCIYVGDGLNDVGALSEANVSFALKGAFKSTFQVSDIYAPQKDLFSITEMIQLSRKIHRTVKTNLAFALIYNTVGGTLALMGFINPLAAAVLMPVSSFLITAHTAWRLL